MSLFPLLVFGLGISAVLADVKFNMFELPNWQGSYLEFAMEAECTDIIPDFNNKGNSIQIQGSGCALLCEDVGCQGSCIKMEGNSPGEADFSLVGYANKVSSVKDCYARSGASDEVAAIPGTSLFTNTWYQVNLKNTGLLTWEYGNRVNGDAYHVQIVYNTGAKEYQLGEELYEDTEWMILPSEVSGYYLLVNKKLPNAVITTEGAATSGKWVVGIDGKANAPEYLAGGSRRDDALWKFVPDTDYDPKFFNIYNRGYPNNGIMTWSGQAVAAGKKYVQIYTSGSVAEAWKHNSDYLWSFTPATTDNGGIPGTSLKTNVWYQINLYNKGLLTWTDTRVSDGYHVEIVFGAAADDYKKGNRFYSNAQWMILPSEHLGQYVMVNRGLPNAVLTWEGDATSGKWVVLIDGQANDPAYKAGGSQRKDALWKIKKQYQDYYNIFNVGFPDNGIMTWSGTGEGAGTKYIQIYSTGSANAYLNNGDYLWSFTEV